MPVGFHSANEKLMKRGLTWSRLHLDGLLVIRLPIAQRAGRRNKTGTVRAPFEALGRITTVIGARLVVVVERHRNFLKSIVSGLGEEKIASCSPPRATISTLAVPSLPLWQTAR
jgi:hypothetical protein